MPDTYRTISLLASDFANAPPTATIDKLLKVSPKIFLIARPGSGVSLSGILTIFHIASFPEIQCQELVFTSGQHPLRDYPEV
jgi:hypothetical protein